MVAFLVESMGRALVFARLTATRGEGPKVLQQRPASQTTFARSLVSVKTTTGVQKSRQPIHQTIHQVARPMTAGMRVADGILCRPVPKFCRHIHYHFRPIPLFAPFAESSHPFVKFLSSRCPVHFPHPVVQRAGLAPTITDLQETVQKTIVDPRFKTVV